MKFKELKEKLFLKKEGIIINKKVTVRGKEILLLGLIKEDRCNKLYALYKNDYVNDIKQEYEEGSITNREDLINRAKASKNNFNIWIREMIIQGQKFTITSSSATSLEYYDGLEKDVIKHFIENGVITEEWDNVDSTDILFACYEQAEEEDFPQINLDEKIVITLDIAEDTEEVLIQHPLTVYIWDYPKNTKIDYIDEDNNEDFLYLNEVGRYDLWEDTLKNLDNMFIDIEESEREEFIKNHLSDTEHLCPKDMDLLSVSYETEDGSRLRFITKKHLESMVEYKSHGVAMMVGVDEDQYGVNNCIKGVDFLDPIGKDFTGEIEIELFSKYVKIPKEVITIEK